MNLIAALMRILTSSAALHEHTTLAYWLLGIEICVG
jgi:hypothetical protein